MLCKNIYRNLFTHPQNAAISGTELVSCKTSARKVLEVYHVFTTSSRQACPQGEEPLGQNLLQRPESLWNDPGNNSYPARRSKGHIRPMPSQARLEGLVEFCFSVGISLTPNLGRFLRLSLGKSKHSQEEEAH